MRNTYGVHKIGFVGREHFFTPFPCFPSTSQTNQSRQEERDKKKRVREKRRDKRRDLPREWKVNGDDWEVEEGGYGFWRVKGFEVVEEEEKKMV